MAYVAIVIGANDVVNQDAINDEVRKKIVYLQGDKDVALLKKQINCARTKFS